MSASNPKPTEIADGCQTCGYETLELKEYFENGFKPLEERDSWWMCEVCAQTHIMSTFMRPKMFDSDTQVILQAINIGVNQVLAAIKEK